MAKKKFNSKSVAKRIAIQSPWNWPRYSPRYDDRTDRKELTCRHGIGHGGGNGTHGCDGCCVDPAFRERFKEEFPNG